MFCKDIHNIEGNYLLFKDFPGLGAKYQVSDLGLQN